jgi:hypothetical protein
MKIRTRSSDYSQNIPPDIFLVYNLTEFKPENFYLNILELDF